MSSSSSDNPDTNRGRTEENPCAAEDPGDCDQCEMVWDKNNNKRGRGQGSTRCTATCKTSGNPCARVARVNTVFCAQHTHPDDVQDDVPDDVTGHTPFMLPDDVTVYMLGFVTPEDRRKEFGITSRRNRNVAKEKMQRQIWGSCDGCRDKDKMSLYFKRTVDKNCPDGSNMV